MWLRHTPFMPTSEKKIWFPAKKYGWGWGAPVCWQGWVVMAVYVLLLALDGIFVGPDRHPVLFMALFLPLTILLGFICWLKGEKPGWRWGGR